MRIIIILISIAALALAATLAALGPAYRFGMMDLGDAFGLMRTIALPTLIAAGLADGGIPWRAGRPLGHGLGPRQVRRRTEELRKAVY